MSGVSSSTMVGWPRWAAWPNMNATASWGSSVAHLPAWRHQLGDTLEAEGGSMEGGEREVGGRPALTPLHPDIPTFEVEVLCMGPAELADWIGAVSQTSMRSSSSCQPRRQPDRLLTTSTRTYSTRSWDTTCTRRRCLYGSRSCSCSTPRRAQGAHDIPRVSSTLSRAMTRYDKDGTGYDYDDVFD